MSTKLLPKENIKDSLELNFLFLKDKIYEFVYVDNRYTKIHDYIGYVIKDEEKKKRWITSQFKEDYFEESVLL